jgi:hypothetical protein
MRAPFGSYVRSVGVGTDRIRLGPHDEAMLTAEAVDTSPDLSDAVPTPSLSALATIAFAVATLITIAWIALGVLLVGS